MSKPLSLEEFIASSAFTIADFQPTTTQSGGLICPGLAFLSEPAQLGAGKFSNGIFQHKINGGMVFQASPIDQGTVADVLCALPDEQEDEKAEAVDKELNQFNAFLCDCADHKASFRQRQSDSKDWMLLAVVPIDIDRAEQRDLLQPVMLVLATAGPRTKKVYVMESHLFPLTERQLKVWRDCNWVASVAENEVLKQMGIYLSHQLCPTRPNHAADVVLHRRSPMADVEMAFDRDLQMYSCSWNDIKKKMPTAGAKTKAKVVVDVPPQRPKTLKKVAKGVRSPIEPLIMCLTEQEVASLQEQTKFWRDMVRRISEFAKSLHRHQAMQIYRGQPAR